MPSVCAGTCSNCGHKRLWASYTLSLQLDNGRLTCLRHPGEDWECERHGLTLGQASKRCRLYLETFYVCRNCGREGETVARLFERDAYPSAIPVTRAKVLLWVTTTAAALMLFAWLRWWIAFVDCGGTLLVAPPLAIWSQNRSHAKWRVARGLPRPDAPGQFQIPEPNAGVRSETILGRVIGKGANRWPQATGPCCDNPDWLPAGFVSDENRILCRSCGAGVMVVSDHGIS